MTDEKQHWIETDATRRKFWAYVKGEPPDGLGLTEDEVHEGLGHEHVADFDGDKAAAMVLLKQFSEDKLDGLLDPPSVALDGIKTISVTYERKFNLGNYESLHIGMTAWGDVHDETTHDEVQSEMWAWVKEAVKEQALPVIKKAKSKSVSQTQPPATQPAVPPVSTPSAPPVGGPPLPPAPPNGNGDTESEGGSETYLIDVIIAQVSPNGNRYYAVRGGRVKKHGATAWPEIAEPQLKKLTDYDVTNLEIGKPWDVSGFHIQAVGEIPAGKNYPTKVTAFAPSP